MAENDIVTKKVDITPDVSLLPKLGHSGYRLSEALAEFIDNSLDAKPTEQKSVNVDIQVSENRIIVSDDASGMNEEEAINSLKLAHSDKKEKLGEFGLGLKTASTSLGKKFRIKTSKKEEKNWYVLDYDEDRWQEVSDWKSQELKLIPKENPEEHGTTITIQDLKINYYPNLITNTKKQLSFRFAPYLENSILKIMANTTFLEAPDIDLIGGKQNIKLIVDENNSITGWYGFLTRRKGLHYGFNLYKHGRLIKAEEKFGFEPHAEVALLYGVLNLDFVPTTHNKREFIETSYEYKLAEDIFRKYLKENRITVKARELSKSTTFKKRREKVEKDVGELFDAIFKFLKETKKEGKIEEKILSAEIKEKEEIEKIKLLHRDQQFNLNKLEEGNVYDLRIMGKTFKFKFDFINLGKDKEILQYYRENNNITILINIDFPLYEYMVKDYGLYSLFLISEVISEVIVKEMGYEPSKILQIRNLMLRKYGEIQKEIMEFEKIEEEKKKLLEKMKKLEEQERILQK